jgi:fucose permease
VAHRFSHLPLQVWVNTLLRVLLFVMMILGGGIIPSLQGKLADIEFMFLILSLFFYVFAFVHSMVGK